jgi:hypothetical protein
LHLIFHRLGVPAKQWWRENATHWPFGSFEQGTPSPLTMQPWGDVTSDTEQQHMLTEMVALSPRNRKWPGILM